MLCDFGVTTNIPGFSVPEVPELPLPRCLSCQQQRAKDLWHSYGIAVPSQQWALLVDLPRYCPQLRA